jgi:hypothetical protein
LADAGTDGSAAQSNIPAIHESSTAGFRVVPDGEIRAFRSVRNTS